MTKYKTWYKWILKDHSKTLFGEEWNYERSDGKVIKKIIKDIFGRFHTTIAYKRKSGLSMTKWDRSYSSATIGNTIEKVKKEIKRWF